MLYNVSIMVNLWGALTSRDVRLLKNQIDKLDSLPENCWFVILNAMGAGLQPYASQLMCGLRSRLGWLGCPRQSRNPSTRLAGPAAATRVCHPRRNMYNNSSRQKRRLTRM